MFYLYLSKNILISLPHVSLYSCHHLCTPHIELNSRKELKKLKSFLAVDGATNLGFSFKVFDMCRE